MSSTRYFKYGWNRDLPDARDYCRATKPVPHPDKVDLRPMMPLVFDQGPLGSCVAQASVAAFMYAYKKQTQRDCPVMSRLFVYYNARALENSIKSDDGCQIRDAVKQLVKLGAAPEDEWQYVISNFAVKPPKKAFDHALDNQLVLYSSVAQSEYALENTLAIGFPVVCGIMLYDSFESEEVAKTGIVPMPNVKKEHGLGGHAVLIVGYDKVNRLFLMRNSWGDDWGMGGYFTIPYEYILNPKLTSDFWQLSMVEEAV